MKRFFRFGPGTILAIVIAAAVIISGRLMESSKPGPGVGDVVYEADAHGRMRQVSAPSVSSASVPPLWKPEPGLLIEHASHLKLTAAQTARIQSLSAAWVRERAQLQQELSQAGAGAGAVMSTAKPGHGVSAAQMNDSLRDYSELSRVYDARRAGFWAQASDLLSAPQRAAVEKMRLQGARG